MMHWWLILAMTTWGCLPKSDEDDEGDGSFDDTPSGSAEFTVTDLNDPTGMIQTHWTDNANWFWAETIAEAEVMNWLLSEQTNEFSFGVETYVIPLQASAGSQSCDEFRELLKIGERLVYEVDLGDSTDDHCAALTEYFEQVDAQTTLHDEFKTHFTLGHQDLIGRPSSGDFGDLGPSALDDHVGLSLYDQIGRPGAGWDATNCEYTYTQTYSDVFRWHWEEPGPNLQVESVDFGDDLVVGSLEGDLTTDDDGSLHLQVDFEARLCKYSGGGLLYLSQ